METLKIKAILSAVEQGSLSKAAENLSYTPSALSHMADALEEELGVRLLKRTPFGVELTKAGEELLEKLQLVLQAEAELIQTTQKLRNEKAKSLKIGAFSSISQHILPELLGGFKRFCPEVNVSISVGNRLLGWLEEDTVDIIFTDEPVEGTYERLTFKKENYVAVVPMDTFQGRKSVTREELYEYAYISVNEMKLKQYFDEKRFKEVVYFDSVDDMSVVSMVREGVGVAVLPSLVVSKQNKGVRIVKLEPDISRTLAVVYKKSLFPDSGVAKFVDFLHLQKKVL